MTAYPSPPILVVHEKTAFWVERRPIESWAATVQAIKDGCFLDSHCYDATGNLWPITGVEFIKPPSLLERLIPWRTVAICLSLGEPTIPTIPDMVSMILKTFDNEAHEFSFTTVNEILKRIENVSKPTDLIKILGSVV